MSAMRRLVSRIRFLPLTIFATVLMLTVKVSDIWQGVEGITGGALEIAQASAQTAEEPGQQEFAPAAEDGLSAQGADNLGVSGGGPVAEADPFDFGEDPVEAAADRIVNQDPTLLTSEEIALLQRLTDRRVELDAREKEIEQRTGLLKAAEERIDDKIRQLRVFQETIEGLIKTYDGQQEQKMQSLVKIYENMKPKEAARIFEDLAMDTLLSVAERMKERKLSAVMAKMNPEKARDVTVELSRLRDLPEAGSTGGG